MRIKLNFIALLSGLLIPAGCISYKEVIITNKSSLSRTNEVVSLTNLPKLCKSNFIITDNTGKQIPYQKTTEGELLFPVSVNAYSSIKYIIRKGVPEKFDTLCYGSFRADRMDDFIWENDKSGYRTYGPALQAKGEKAFGYDVFTKSVGHLVMSDRFNKAIYGKPKVSFHLDHGDGMDSYGVGATLGCGADALVSSEKLIYPWCWTDYKIIENGPIRFKARFNYSPVEIDGKKVTEIRTITLDMTSPLNEVEVSFQGLDKEVEIVSGVVVHKDNPTAYKYGKSNQGGYTAYADLGDRNVGKNGEIYVGTAYTTPLVSVGYVPFTEDELQLRGGATGHVLGIGKYKPNHKYVYYFGSQWSKSGIKSLDEWEQIIKDFIAKKTNPLEITLKK